MKTSSFSIEAKELLDSMQVVMKSTFLYNGPYFSDEEENRDVYQVIFTKEGRGYVKPLIIKFGQSIAQSSKPNKQGKHHPTAYDILACIEKHEVSPILKEWCSELGYDDDSIKASKTHQTCLEQYRDVSQFFTPEELLKIQEIQ